MVHSITDYTKTQRILFLIDLTPLLHHHQQTQNHRYLTSLLSTIEHLLSFPPFSSSLFSFKLFFSSLSPLLSSSKLPFSPLTLSFDHPTNTFRTLSHSLSSLFFDPSSFSSLTPSAVNVAATLQEILHEYAWDSVECDSLMGMPLNFDFSAVKSHLVILFSPISKDFKWFAEFFDAGMNDECLRDENLFNEKFCGVFESVNEGFICNDIHFSWVDMKCDVGCVGFDGSDVGFQFFKGGVQSLGWGFCSSDSIVLGSALVPFGLIYPRIGVSSKVFDFNDGYERVRAQLSLEILDVSEKPLECKCCDLELVNLSMFLRARKQFVDLQTGGCEQRKSFLEDIGDGVVKIHVKAAQMYDKGVKFGGSLSDPIIVRELSGHVEKVRNDNSSEFFEDRVLQLLGIETGELVQKKSLPTWQILLSFLYREGYYALVSLSTGDGNSVTGILKPFTVCSALLVIIGDESHHHGITGKFDGASLGQIIKNIDEAHISKTNLSKPHGHMVCGPFQPDKYIEPGESKRKKNKRNSSMLQELTWSAFCKEALANFQIDLEEVYFARGYNKSKKLKFLKCWMKQIKKSSHCILTMPDRSQQCQDIPKEVDDRSSALAHESEQPVASCASVGEDSLTGASRIEDDAALHFRSENLESFFSDLPHKIQQGLESEEVDVGTLAARLVNSSIYWLYQKFEKEITSENETPGVKVDGSSASVVTIELTKRLLRDPKDLAAMHRDSDASNLSSSEISSENIVRAYELQILFRMEIMQSEIGASIGESTKHKFVKHICLLLEAIQCHLKGGFFGDWSLDSYVGKIIKSRYCQNLGDVVHRIYEKLDLLLFSEEDELANPLLNSDESNQPWRDEIEGHEMEVHNRINDRVSVEGDSLQRMENESQSPVGMYQDEHARKLIEAQERRQRARRFASFTSWVPDLRRIWAPKQPKAMKTKSGPLRRLSRRKGLSRSRYDMVCDTPMTGNKRSCDRVLSSLHREYKAHGTSMCGSVSKALFQDNDEPS